MDPGVRLATTASGHIRLAVPNPFPRIPNCALLGRRALAACDCAGAMDNKQRHVRMLPRQGVEMEACAGLSTMDQKGLARRLAAVPGCARSEWMHAK